MRLSKKLCSLILLSLIAPNFAGASPWLESHLPISQRKILDNISAPGTALGSVIASPSTRDPDYFFHWTRDAALAMDAVLTLELNTNQREDRLRLRRAVIDYTYFSRINQMTRSPGDLGEPKYYVSGAPYEGPWGRPQNDGPAVRAITLIRFAEVLLAEGQEDFVRAVLYDSLLPTHSVIKTDLEYISHHAFAQSYDLWEEVKGQHFYTRMVTRRALIAGSRLARRMGDAKAAEWYESRALILTRELEAHWDPSRQIILPTLARTEGVDYKTSELDSAVILAALHGDAGDGFFSAQDPRVLATLEKQKAAFARAYPINFQTNLPGVAIGRYPEDRYSGSDFLGGNPWVLTTLAFAEVLYRSLPSRTPAEASFLRAEADAYVARVTAHANPDGSLAEQIDRRSGYMISARDLTWNYAAVVSAWLAEQDAK